MLLVAIIIFALDVLWQFWAAIVVGPKKAKELIINSEEFQRLEQKLTEFENKYSVLSDSMDSLSLTVSGSLQEVRQELSKFGGEALDVNPVIAKLDTKLSEMKDHLKGVINGGIGNLAKGYYDEVGLGPEGSAEEEKITKELANMQIKTVAQEQKYNFYYNLIEPMAGEERAHKLAVGLVLAPPWLKGIVKKRVVGALKDYGGV